MYTKHITALQLMDAVITASKLDIDKPQKEQLCVTAWDETFTFIHANFAIPETVRNNIPDYLWDKLVHGINQTAVNNDTPGINYEKIQKEINLCRPLIDGTYLSGSIEMETAMRDIPPTILEVVWPVAIARFLLRDHAVPLLHRKSSTFPEFHRRYGLMILSS